MANRTEETAERNRNAIPFESYDEYMKHVFDCVNRCLREYLENMKTTFSNGQGGYKNVLYPDLEIASDAASNHVMRFDRDQNGGEDFGDMEDFFSDGGDAASGADDDDDESLFDEELAELFGSFGADSFEEDEEAEDFDADSMMGSSTADSDNVTDRIVSIQERAAASAAKGITMPFYDLCVKMGFDPFTIFCFACGILSSTQTDYAGIFQIVNENGGLSTPTIESAGRLYYGNTYSITGAYGDMSVCLEQLLPVLDLKVIPSMPFSTAISPDKRIIDFLFGKNPYKLDENYVRFMRMLTKEGEQLDDILCNQNVLDAMLIAYKEGSRLFSYCGDEGSGRKFFVRKFCQQMGLRAISVNCKKLFVYDYSYVEKAIWAVTRECILNDGCCVLDELQYREEEKEKFFGYMDLFFTKLTEKGITVFANTKESINFKEITKEEITLLNLAPPDIDGRTQCWDYYAKGYQFGDDVDFFEMSTKFLFTPGKIKDAVHYSHSLAVMQQTEVVDRATLFKSCNAQMSSELSQKATRVEAKFGFDDIVMNADQREQIGHAIEQMNNKKQVYETWNYMKKYPYGRGLTVLLYGAPGTGKSMMAQVLAHELNLELYRVDISKVVDKYVGETEKSLSMIFREAKKCNVVLFFDECDTIFAKRADDGGSNQASANNKTALLLQEMEAYDGVCVLATNYKHNIDPAFFRRMKYIVEFQFPNVDTREMLWTTTVPKTTPLAEDVDFRFIAEKFEFAGGNIKNCVLNAAFLAAEDPTSEGMVHMRHYLLAIKYEFVKVGKVFTRADFEPFADEIFGPEPTRY
ncbi:MAG: ATP-binding protein [Lachnospiraceae bacterium]|nr:ATP-binding protein [Lachnospiraceae bacterium]